MKNMNRSITPLPVTFANFPVPPVKRHVLVIPGPDHPTRPAMDQRRKATSDQIASTAPNGHAPCRKP
jgi:hypothetical protein